MFHGDGQLNHRVRAEAEIAAGLGTLWGPEWKKVRNFLLDRRSLAFLDRMHQRLAEAEPRTEWRDVLVWRWWRLRHPASAANPLAAQVFAVALQRPLEDAEQVAYDRIEAILVSTFRASSAVECMNSVLRMQQSRHRRMTQPMLDLKRLYWNCRPFRSGPRKNTSPYRALGLELPTFNFWNLLQSDPRELMQQLSTSGNKDLRQCPKRLFEKNRSVTVPRRSTRKTVQASRWELEREVRSRPDAPVQGSPQSPVGGWKREWRREREEPSCQSSRGKLRTDQPCRATKIF